MPATDPCESGRSHREPPTSCLNAPTTWTDLERARPRRHRPHHQPTLLPAAHIHKTTAWRAFGQGISARSPAARRALIEVNETKKRADEGGRVFSAHGQLNAGLPPAAHVPCRCLLLCLPCLSVRLCLPRTLNPRWSSRSTRKTSRAYFSDTVACKLTRRRWTAKINTRFEGMDTDAIKGMVWW